MDRSKINSLPHKLLTTLKTKVLENTVGKGENAGNRHFLLFRQCFLLFHTCKVLSFGKGLKHWQMTKEVQVQKMTIFLRGDQDLREMAKILFASTFYLFPTLFSEASVSFYHGYAFKR